MSYPNWIKVDTGFEIQIYKNIMSLLVGTWIIVLLEKLMLLAVLNVFTYIYQCYTTIITKEKIVPFH